MSYESLVRMVEYSHKMVEKILKEVEENFIARKELFHFSIFQAKVWKIEIDRIYTNFLSPMSVISVSVSSRLTLVSTVLYGQYNLDQIHGDTTAPTKV